MQGAMGMSKAKGKAVSKNQVRSERKQIHYKLVLSETCAVCKTPCSRGMNYFEQMQKPGAVGYGVPCVLTKTYS